MKGRLPKAYSRVAKSKLSLSDLDETPTTWRQWVRIDSRGVAKLVTVRPAAASAAMHSSRQCAESREVQVDKHDIVRELNLATRDMITVDQEVCRCLLAAVRAACNLRLLGSAGAHCIPVRAADQGASHHCEPGQHPPDSREGPGVR